MSANVYLVLSTMLSSMGWGVSTFCLYNSPIPYPSENVQYFSTFQNSSRWYNMGEYFEGVFYEERALSYMGLAILGVIAISFIVLFLWLSKKRIVSDETAIVVCILCSAYLVLMCAGFYNGYLEPDHGNQLKENISSYREAVEWNKEEQRCNNYFFRFTLRDEDLVDLGEYEDVRIS